MAFKTIYYTVGIDGILPATQQDGGVQHSHNVTQLSFSLSPDLQSKLTDAVTEHGYTIAYRFDGHTGTGAVKSTVPQTLSPVSATLDYYLENWITKDGGNILVYLVITVMDGEDTEIESYSYPAKLRLTSVPSGSGDASDSLPSITTLYEQTEENAQIASDAAASARADAQSAAIDAQRTEESRIILEDDTTFVYQGGDAQHGAGEGVVGLVVDTIFNTSSHNPSESQAIAAYMNGAFLTAINTAISNAITAAKEEVQNRLYPVGKIVHLYDDESDPHDIFGFGTWEQITERFLFGASAVTDEDPAFAAGDTGGEAEHELVTNEMPRHKHNLNASNAGVDDTNRGYNAPWVYKKQYTVDVFSGYTGGTNQLQEGHSIPHNNMPPYTVVYIWRRVADPI